ncbi:MAG: hypothetical protein V2B19_11415 [Pseudomonadota bacterium]
MTPIPGELHRFLILPVITGIPAGDRNIFPKSGSGAFPDPLEQVVHSFNWSTEKPAGIGGMRQPFCQRLPPIFCPDRRVNLSLVLTVAVFITISIPCTMCR